MNWPWNKKPQPKINRLDFVNDYEYALMILRTIEEDIEQLKNLESITRLEIARDFHKIVLRYLSNISKR